MAGDPTHYDAIGVSSSATAEEIRAAWLATVKDSHPDTHPDDPVAETRCKRANAAWDVLGNEDTRKDYDLLLARRAAAPPPPPPRPPPPDVPRWAPSDPYGGRSPFGGGSSRFRHAGLASANQWSTPVWYDRSSWSPGQERLENEFGNLGVWGRDGMPRYGRR